MNQETRHFEGRTILVTGAAGFIGSSLIRALSQVKCTLICHTREAARLELPVETRAHISIREGDIRTPALWQKLLKGVDTVFHFAAQTSAGFANAYPMEDLSINVSPITRFLEACQELKIRPDMIFPGTVTEVGMTRDYPVDESLRDCPVTIYDIHKLSSEHYLHYYADQLGGRAVTLRLANVYGPGPRSSRPDRGILNMMVMRALTGKPLTVYGDGSFVRDYLYIDDVVRAFIQAAARLDTTSGRHYVLGSGAGHSIRDMIETVAGLVAEMSGLRIRIDTIPLPSDLSPIECRHFVADTARFQADSGWTPEISFKEGIRRTVQFFLKEMHP